MTKVFVGILNMSITASYVAIAVILVRLLLRRAPKIFSYMLWSAVIIRLVIPGSFTSNFSLLRLVQPDSGSGTGVLGFVPQDLGMRMKPAVDVGIGGINRWIDHFLPTGTAAASINPMQIVLGAGTIVWLTGAAFLLVYSTISYCRILHRVRTATRVSGNIFESERIMTPFVCGFVRPRIYIPTGLSGHERTYIILHEQTHLRRRDYLIKPLMFLLLILHWFNPLIWLSYALMGKDMEMSCDEAVVKKLGEQIKGSYSTSLLVCSMRRSGLLDGSPLAFGEGHVKGRINNILAYRQPSFRLIAGCTLVIAALLVSCTANPKPLQPSQQLLYSVYPLEKLMESKTVYVGDHNKVLALIAALPCPEGLKDSGIELKTGSRPYELTIRYDMNDYVGVWDDAIEALSRKAFYRNSVLLLSLIGNVDHINYSVVDHTGRYNGAAYSFIFTRAEIDELLGGDVRRYAADMAGLRQLIDRMDI